jgi:hypothetical protein
VSREVYLRLQMYLLILLKHRIFRKQTLRASKTNIQYQTQQEMYLIFTMFLIRATQETAIESYPLRATGIFHLQVPLAIQLVRVVDMTPRPEVPKILPSLMLRHHSKISPSPPWRSRTLYKMPESKISGASPKVPTMNHLIRVSDITFTKGNPQF